MGEDVVVRNDLLAGRYRYKDGTTDHTNDERYYYESAFALRTIAEGHDASDLTVSGNPATATPEARSGSRRPPRPGRGAARPWRRPGPRPRSTRPCTERKRPSPSPFQSMIPPNHPQSPTNQPPAPWGQWNTPRNHRHTPRSQPKTSGTERKTPRNHHHMLPSVRSAPESTYPRPPSSTQPRHPPLRQA